MPAITNENRNFWQAIGNDAAKNKPYVGREVEVIAGRKHKGKRGKVLRHMIDKYYDPFRYGYSAEHHLIDLIGRNGFVVLVKQNDGATFWVRADYVNCI